MRVAWVHPTWRDLVIDRLSEDAELRHRFLARCGPHGIVLALSTEGGATGERRLPLIRDDEDWDAVGDRIYTLVPELEHAELASVLRAVGRVVREVAHAPERAGEARALAQMALDRAGSTWDAAAAPVSLDCLDAWLQLATLLGGSVRPGFLAPTWCELLPVRLPDPGDLSEYQRFADWMTLYDLVLTYAPDMLDELDCGATQRSLRSQALDRAHREQRGREQAGRSPVADWEIEEARAQRSADNVIRRVLVDL
jgi:hypothetical protein